MTVTAPAMTQADAPDAAPAAPHAVVGSDTRRSGVVRVMHLVYRLQPHGMELGVVKIVNGLDRGRVVSSICSTTPAIDVTGLVRPDVPVFELRRRAGNDPALVWRLLRLFRRERPHIIHTHSWGTLFEGLLAARLARVPWVVHGEHGTLQLQPYQIALQRFGWSRADVVLSVSSRLAERMAQATGFPRDRIRVIRNGVDLARFGHANRHEARQALALPEDRFVIGAVGRLVPVKDHANLIEAVALLRQRGVDATVVIVGEGPLRAELEALAAARAVGDHVRLLGHRPDVEAVMAGLDVFVLCSRSEGLSNTILEAMASGLPVVATAVGGADELVQPDVTGALVPPESPAALADALAALSVSAERRARMGAAGRQRAETEFSIAGMIRNYGNLYADLGARLQGRG